MRRTVGFAPSLAGRVGVAALGVLVRGRTLTSFPSVRRDIRNAGGNVVDEEVVTNQGLVSSRSPDDLPTFCAKIVEEFAEGEHRIHDEGATARAGS
jgi:protease I